MVDANQLAQMFVQMAQGNYGQFGQPGNFKRKQDLTPTTVTLYASCGLFSVCGPDSVLSRVITDDQFTEWLGFRENHDEYQFIKTLDWVGPYGTADHDPTHAAGDACDDPASVEWGTCEFLIEKGLLRQCGDPLDITKVGERYCDKQPLYTIDGMQIDNDIEWQSILSGLVLNGELNRYLIVGNKAVDGEFDGLEQLVNTGYVDVHTGQACTPVDSIVSDWNYAAMSATLLERIFAYIRRIKMRAKKMGGVARDDMIIMLPSFLRDCLMETWVCYGICDETGDSTSRWETRDRNERYVGKGTYGDGYITVDGVDVDILTNDNIPLTSVAPYFCSDIYILTRRLGNIPVMFGQFQDMRLGDRALQNAMGTQGFTKYITTDMGRFIHWVKTDNLCIQVCSAIKPALYLAAPWAQARIDNVCCQVQGGLSPEIPQSCQYFYGGYPPYESFCPESYMID